ncbi:hypothetical protein [Siminovitchia fortis]|uniref:cucumopine synthase-related protein n=1 Tax=Siminovitchia fortis TaxID=254758 RepID=UPI0011AA22A3|nr:hypothetical protein [Siminovitchia fortis]
MSKHWKEVKAEIEREIDHIFWEEPEEVKMSRLGIFPSGAGTDGQVLGNLFFLVCDTQAMGWWTVEPAIHSAIEDKDFSLEHCKKMWKYMTVHMAALMGEVMEPNCPAPWLNLPKLWKFCQDIVDSFDTVTTKEEFKSIIWSWGNYVNCLNRWFMLIFPMELGKAFPRVEQDTIKEMAQLSNLFTNVAETSI